MRHWTRHREALSKRRHMGQHAMQVNECSKQKCKYDNGYSNKMNKDFVMIMLKTHRKPSTPDDIPGVTFHRLQETMGSQHRGFLPYTCQYQGTTSLYMSTPRDNAQLLPVRCPVRDQIDTEAEGQGQREDETCAPVHLFKYVKQ